MSFAHIKTLPLMNIFYKISSSCCNKSSFLRAAAHILAASSNARPGILSNFWRLRLNKKRLNLYSIPSRIALTNEPTTQSHFR